MNQYPRGVLMVFNLLSAADSLLGKVLGAAVFTQLDRIKDFDLTAVDLKIVINGTEIDVNQFLTALQQAFGDRLEAVEVFQPQDVAAPMLDKAALLKLVEDLEGRVETIVGSSAATMNRALLQLVEEARRALGPPWAESTVRAVTAPMVPPADLGAFRRAVGTLKSNLQ